MATRLPTIIAPKHLAAMLDLAKTMPRGAFCEVGVFQGGSASCLYEITTKQGRALHLFDTFVGTPVYKPGLDKHMIGSEFAAPTTPDIIRAIMPDAKLHIGIYPQTHPSDLRDVAFIHCDCDQYDSYRAVIDKMWPLVVKGGALWFDDYPYLNGAKRAVEESFELSSLCELHGRYYVIKP